MDAAAYDVRIVDGKPVVFVRSTGLPFTDSTAIAAADAGSWIKEQPSRLFPTQHPPSHTHTPHTLRPAAKREKTRLTQESGARVGGEAAGARIGGPFARAEEPAFLAARAAVYDEVMTAQRERLARKPRVPIAITLPDGKVVAGVSWETTPLMVAEGISKGLAAAVVVAKVTHSGRVGAEPADGTGMVNTGPDEEEGVPPSAAAAELWDLVRPLEGDCALELKKFDDKEGKMVFWHSSAHVLGECMECKFGAKLCIGPPTEDGFYYDAYMGDS
jgi:threonyl-tRNA synthetase